MKTDTASEHKDPLPNTTVTAGPALAPAAMKLKTMLVPIDFSPSCHKALAYAISFADQFGAAISLVHVVEPMVYPAELGYAPVEIESLSQSSRENALRRLDEIEARITPPRLRGSTMVRTGSAHHEIVTAAKELKVDLIVIATHGHSGLKHVLLGSTVERVLRHAPCPVFVVREREHDFV